MKEKKLIDIKTFESLSPSDQIHLKGMGVPPQGGDQGSGAPPSFPRSDCKDTSNTSDQSGCYDQSGSHDNSSSYDNSSNYDNSSRADKSGSFD